MKPLEEIFSLAAALSGGSDPRLEAICGAVFEYLKQKLRRGVSVEDCRSSFVFAGGLMSTAVLQALDSEGLSGFDAGTMKLTFEDKTNAMAAAARELLEPWCRDDVAFRGVRG